MVDLLNIFCLHYPPALSIYVLTLHHGSQPVSIVSMGFLVLWFALRFLRRQKRHEQEITCWAREVRGTSGQGQSSWRKCRKCLDLETEGSGRWEFTYTVNLPQKESGTFIDSRSQSFTCNFVICTCKYEWMCSSKFNLLSHLLSPLPPNYIHIHT